jgi:hypothetical protein
METARELIEALGFKWFSAVCLCCSLCFGWLLGWSLGFNEITYSPKKKHIEAIRTEDMETAREHIEAIRKKKFSIGGEENPLTEDLHQAVKNLSAQLYAKDVHFLMELIQVPS